MSAQGTEGKSARASGPWEKLRDWRAQPRICVGLPFPLSVKRKKSFFCQKGLTIIGETTSRKCSWSRHPQEVKGGDSGSGSVGKETHGRGERNMPVTKAFSLTLRESTLWVLEREAPPWQHPTQNSIPTHLASLPSGFSSKTPPSGRTSRTPRSGHVLPALPHSHIHAGRLLAGGSWVP